MQSLSSCRQAGVLPFHDINLACQVSNGQGACDKSLALKVKQRQRRHHADAQSCLHHASYRRQLLDLQQRVRLQRMQSSVEHLFKKLPYDPVKDFTPLTALGRGGQIMVVNPTLPVKNVSEFITLAKSKPGMLSFGSGSSSSRVAGEQFKQMTGTYILNIPYKSNPPAVTDLLGGQIDMMITDMATGLPQVKAGKLKALGVSTRQRSPLAPEVPTIDEAGVKGYEMTYWFAAYAPAGTPADVVAKLSDILVKAARSSSAAPFYQSTGTEVFTSNPDELRKFQAAETIKWGRIIKGAGIEPE
jgi:tripartite-type tricarboxylate transporter receptor subunit TctC